MLPEQRIAACPYLERRDIRQAVRHTARRARRSGPTGMSRRGGKHGALARKSRTDDCRDALRAESCVLTLAC